ncbi:MAG: DM13 domain-containing protein [Cyclobacteriaceae bacterium]|nr:DM13 domain-containing protein [Cyclobacteriaceae bacterium]
MKTSCIIILIALLSACQPELTTPVNPADASNVDLTGLTPLKSGMFVGIGGHTAAGTVLIYEKNSKKYIVFDPYSSQAGPDLKVYLSKDENASDYIRVGKLQSTTGRQTYEVVGNPEIDQYPFVHIWCEQFSVEFARAPLN